MANVLSLMAASRVGCPMAESFSRVVSPAVVPAASETLQPETQFLGKASYYYLGLSFQKLTDQLPED